MFYLLFIVILGILSMAILFFNYYAIGEVVGISMEPYLNNGQYFLVRKKDFTLEVGSVYMFKLEDEEVPFIKRLVEIRKEDEFLYFLGDNPDHSYDSRNFGFVDPSTVLGEVIFHDGDSPAR